MNSETLYAVAVRDEAESFIVLTLCRRSDNIYYNLPRDHDPDWKPHGSFHASGQRHHKSFNHKMGIAYGQKPNEDFKGTERQPIQPAIGSGVPGVRSGDEIGKEPGLYRRDRAHST